MHGSPANLKITRPDRPGDRRGAAPCPLTAPPTPRLRVGQGFDVHPFSDDPGRPLVLGGVTFAGRAGPRRAQRRRRHRPRRDRRPAGRGRPRRHRPALPRHRSRAGGGRLDRPAAPGGGRRAGRRVGAAERRLHRRPRGAQAGAAAATRSRPGCRTRSARRSPSRASGPRDWAPSAGGRASPASRSPSSWRRREPAPRRARSGRGGSGRGRSGRSGRPGTQRRPGPAARAGQGRGGRRPPPTRISTPGGGRARHAACPRVGVAGCRPATGASAATRSRAARPSASCSSPAGDPVREVWMLDERDDAADPRRHPRAGRRRARARQHRGPGRFAAQARCEAPQGVLALAAPLPEADLDDARRPRSRAAPRRSSSPSTG